MTLKKKNSLKTQWKMMYAAHSNPGGGAEAEVVSDTVAAAAAAAGTFVNAVFELSAAISSISSILVEDDVDGALAVRERDRDATPTVVATPLSFESDLGAVVSGVLALFETASSLERFSKFVATSCEYLSSVLVSALGAVANALVCSWSSPWDDILCLVYHKPVQCKNPVR